MQEYVRKMWKTIAKVLFNLGLTWCIYIQIFQTYKIDFFYIYKFLLLSFVHRLEIKDQRDAYLIYLINISWTNF